ncbi:Dolichol-phosphate mannosyltransferase in lipid-linked oligosaccharide synthesis cluster [Planctomycetales bacterium 10988]|nr:Dolichol-phosphate mannosyltransferase in lipid-linked oligosaccharide synthesis cluster [Planctomycetales bacterium 10988]
MSLIESPSSPLYPSMVAPPRTLVLVATYNERENLPRLSEKILAILTEADLLVIDDNSPDGTADWCEKLADEDDRVFCLRRRGKLGLGTAIVEGMRIAIEEEYDLLINLDADFSHDPAVLPELLEESEAQQVDVVVGSRYASGGGIVGWPWYRKLTSRAVNWFARTLLGIPVSDCSGSYRCYRVDKLAELDFNEVQAQGYAFFEEILWLLQKADATFAEVPILFHDRTIGDSKVNGRELVRSLTNLGQLAVRAWWPFAKAKPKKATSSTESKSQGVPSFARSLREKTSANEGRR